MSDNNIQLTTHELWVDGRQMSIKASKLNPTTLRLTWNLPQNPTAYDGAVVLLSEEKFSSSNYPIDGTRYSASTDWSSPVDKIDHGQVVAAFYGFFGDDVTQTYVDVSNIDPAKIYYASIYATSNILQYYTIGTQSYPLESARFEKQSETYAGSIPYAVVPPSNPSNGQVFFDPTIGKVMVWNSVMSSWVQSNQESIQVGSSPPIKTNQLFYNTIDSTLRFFDGNSWIDCDAQNTRVKLAATHAPFHSIQQLSDFPSSPIIGDFVYVIYRAVVSAPPASELKCYTMGSWFHPSPDLVQVKAGGTWVAITSVDYPYGDKNPEIPRIGDFFYQTTTRDLLVWTGSDWIKADTASEGTPTTDKIGIGTDGSYDERLRIIKVIKHQMGWPQHCVELSEEQFNVAVDNAIDEFRRRADNAYAHKFISFTIRKGQSTYYLNDPRDHTDKIVNVIKIHRINQLGISSLSAETGLYAQAFFNQLYQGSNVDVLSIHMMNQLSELYERIFAGNLTFSWDEPSRQLTLLRRINVDFERVLLEVSMERTEQELLFDRWARQWLQAWTQSEVMEMLGEIRSKFGTLPGPNGGITLNGSELLSRAEALQTELLRQISDYEVGNGGVNFGNTAFLIG